MKTKKSGGCRTESRKFVTVYDRYASVEKDVLACLCIVCLSKVAT